MGMMEEEASAQVEKLLGEYPRVVQVGLTDDIIDDIVKALVRAQEEVIRRTVTELGVNESAAVAMTEPLVEEEWRTVVMECIEKVRQQHAALMSAPSPSSAVH